jgi:putative sugar O-methyltransferase
VLYDRLPALDYFLEESKMKSTSLQSPFLEMLDNYLLTQENRPESEKKIVWNLLLNNLEDIIANTQIWSTFMRNPLGVGLAHELMYLYNEFWSGDVEENTQKINQNFEPLIGETVQDKEKQQEIENACNYLIAQCGHEFLTKYNLSEVGSPASINLTLNQVGSDPIEFPINLTDLHMSYYFYQCIRTLQKVCDTNSPTVIEIGGGYGGVMAKMKMAFPNSRCILLDLPELLPFQTYYLNKVFPEKKFLYFKDYLELGSTLFEDNFDFLIVPHWVIKDIPEVSIDQVINMRSMMEMSNSVISSYFKEIQRITKIGGLFACFNRYYKHHQNEQEIPGSSGELNLLKTYPYDEYWQILLSQTSIIQGHVHDLIVRRQSEKNIFPIMESMKSLPPSLSV